MVYRPRKDVIPPGEVGLYHVWNRCVRQAFLCGLDPITGRDFNYRKGWIRRRLRRLARVMAIDICDYSVLDNHFHLILRARPDLVQEWTDEEVARRWWEICPTIRDQYGDPLREPLPCELKVLLCDAEKMLELRRRLSDVSWFMKFLDEWIAKRANAEDRVKGPFWGGRFGCEALLDAAAVLRCCLYVDLNWIRAMMAQTPEESIYSSAYERIRARWQRVSQGFRGTAADDHASLSEGELDGDEPCEGSDNWLCPLELTEDQPLYGIHPVAARAKDECPATATSAASAVGEQLADNALPCPAANPTFTVPAPGTRQSNPFGAPRVSNKGFLEMTLDQYLCTLDWTGRQVCEGKRGRIPAELAPILERLGIRPEHLPEIVVDYPGRFHSAVGQASEMMRRADAIGRLWLQGIRRAREIFQP